MKRFLITTALEETWRSDEPVLFLGKWCMLHERKERWSTMDAEVLPYHWDDRKKLYGDYLYLKEFHERLLEDLTRELNGIHGVDHSLRYWRILVGPWLGYFVQMLYDRWFSVQEAVNRFDLSGTIILSGQEGAMVPHDMDDFVRLYVSDSWNHHIFASILQEFSTVPFSLKEQSQSERFENIGGTRGKWKARLSRWYAAVGDTLTSDEDAFMLATYLPMLKEVSLCLQLRQFPVKWRSEPASRVQPDKAMRGWVVAGENRSAFEAAARMLIPRQIPVAYLEGYGKLVEQVDAMPWPKRPKFIWTSNAFSNDEVFKAWAADKVEQGSPLLIGQHGGHYGSGLWSFSEDHQVAISDAFLSWGWLDPGQPKIRSIGQLKANAPTKTRHGEQPNALLVTTVVPRYSYWMFSSPVASQWEDSFGDHFAFVEQLPSTIRDALIVRLYPLDLGWNQAARWRERFPGIRLDEGAAEMGALIRRSRLYIATYNATTFLETFTMDVPTVMFWNPGHWELRDAAIPYFDALKGVGVFHETPESAARHVSEIWDDVDGWWRNPEVQGVLERFRQQYCNVPKDGVVKRILDEAARHTNKRMVAES